ncbi:GNAT family N-acetyltransferase [Leifsonia sp. Leaf264]|uniref:GNAT family N-acetyltransferase n=1 Tax=Leifsonia sp. Leaf264 TaxID=1736314 RepID=UPI0006F9B895|nr:GNAT family N-acetyltransferase [Leifsonia sp. Leaf264]KQO98720.1 hypothetical protein ASF30_11705 [Leifsonia sp. Leaf264]
MRVTFDLLTSLSNDGRRVVADAIGDLDYPVGGVRTAAELIDVYTGRAPATSWSVLVDHALAGMFSIGQTDQYLGLQTSIFIAPRHRHRGVSHIINRAAITAARDVGVDLMAGVHVDNQASLGAHDSLFVSDCPRTISPSGKYVRMRISDGQLADGETDRRLAETIATQLAEIKSTWPEEVFRFHAWE